MAVMYIILVSTEITEVNLSAVVYRLFRKDFSSPIYECSLDK